MDVMLVIARLTMKREEDQPEHIESREQGSKKTEGIENVADAGAAILAQEGTQQDRIFAEESGERREAGDRPPGRQHRQIGPANLPAEAAQAAQILLAAPALADPA